jgi:pyruvate,water dikinase
MEYIRNFKQLSKNDAAIAGGKGSSLGEMVNAGIPVPPGFVLLASAFDRFLTEADLSSRIEAVMEQIKLNETGSVDRASKKIQVMILKAKFPEDLARGILNDFIKLKAPLVAVRSSATAEDSLVASWAGELESYLNTTKNNLLENIKHCWTSLFSQRAIVYRFEKKMRKTQVSVAVVVQKMIQSEVSGVVFTVHPVTENRNQLVIEAGWGLGEAIVGGKITPDTYVINKSKIRKFQPKAGPPRAEKVIEDKNISTQKTMIVGGAKGTVGKPVPKQQQDRQKLTDQQIIDLAKICCKIERLYGRPQDIEWALARGRFYIVQARPITTLK